jgi:hypothetical protein
VPIWAQFIKKQRKLYNDINNYGSHKSIQNTMWAIFNWICSSVIQSLFIKQSAINGNSVQSGPADSCLISILILLDLYCLKPLSNSKLEEVITYKDLCTACHKTSALQQTGLHIFLLHQTVPMDHRIVRSVPLDTDHDLISYLQCCQHNKIL